MKKNNLNYDYPELNSALDRAQTVFCHTLKREAKRTAFDRLERMRDILREHFANELDKLNEHPDSWWESDETNGQVSVTFHITLEGPDAKKWVRQQEKKEEQESRAFHREHQRRLKTDPEYARLFSKIVESGKASRVHQEA